MQNNYKAQDILFNLTTYIDSSYNEDMYYTISHKILENLRDIPNISINELADMCYTSPATISRFCKAMKCESFQELKFQIKMSIDDMRSEVSIPKEKLDIMEENPQSFIDLVMDENIKNFETAKRAIDINEIDGLCHAIHDATDVHFFGFQFNKLIGASVQLKLLKLGKLSYAFVGRGDEDDRIGHVHPGNVALILSVSAKDYHIEALIKKLKNRGAYVILITLNQNHNASQYCDEVIILPGKELEYCKSSTLGSTLIKAYFDVFYLRYGVLYKGEIYV